MNDPSKNLSKFLKLSIGWINFVMFVLQDSTTLELVFRGDLILLTPRVLRKKS